MGSFDSVAGHGHLVTLLKIIFKLNQTLSSFIIIDYDGNGRVVIIIIIEDRATTAVVNFIFFVLSCYYDFK